MMLIMRIFLVMMIKMLIVLIMMIMMVIIPRELFDYYQAGGLETAEELEVLLENEKSKICWWHKTRAIKPKPNSKYWQDHNNGVNFQILISHRMLPSTFAP